MKACPSVDEGCSSGLTTRHMAPTRSGWFT